MAEAGLGLDGGERRERSRSVSCRGISFSWKPRCGDPTDAVDHSYYKQAAKLPKTGKHRRWSKQRERADHDQGEEVRQDDLAETACTSRSGRQALPCLPIAGHLGPDLVQALPAPSTASTPVLDTSQKTSASPVSVSISPCSLPDLESGDECTSSSHTDQRDLGAENEQHKPTGGFFRVLDELSRVPYYFGKLSGREAALILNRCPDDTFLVRDSEDDRSLFALTYRTSGAVGSTRIQFREGQFSLNFTDSRLPQFYSVVELIEHCMRSSETHPICLVYINNLPHFVHLRTPLRLPSVPSLQDACRLTIWRSYKRDQIETMHIPTSIRKFLLANPFRQSISI